MPSRARAHPPVRCSARGGGKGGEDNALYADCPDPYAFGLEEDFVFLRAFSLMGFLLALLFAAALTLNTARRRLVGLWATSASLLPMCRR